jgi:hypothetical protein
VPGFRDPLAQLWLPEWQRDGKRGLLYVLVGGYRLGREFDG